MIDDWPLYEENEDTIRVASSTNCGNLAKSVIRHLKDRDKAEVVVVGHAPAWQALLAIGIMTAKRSLSGASFTSFSIESIRRVNLRMDPKKGKLRYYKDQTVLVNSPGFENVIGKLVQCKTTTCAVVVSGHELLFDQSVLTPVGHGVCITIAKR